MKIDFIEKPYVTFTAVILVVAAIIYLEMEKSDLNKIQQTKINKSKNANLSDRSSLNSYNIKEKALNSWINSEPLKIEQLRGKVVLVDFWTLNLYKSKHSIVNLCTTKP